MGLTTDEVNAMLRYYQHDVAGAARKERAGGKRSIIIQAETGAGKTRVASYLIWLCHQRKKRALFLADTRELVMQADNELWNFEVPHGLIMAGFEHDPASVYVASKPTLVRRCLRDKRFSPPDADLIIVDECHASMAPDWLELLRHYLNKGATIIGLTATPARQDGRGLGDFYQSLVSAIPPSKLIAEGYVVPTKVFAPYTPNLRGVKKKAGDYDQKQLAHKMDQVGLVGDIVKHWKLYGEDRQTICYAVDIDHAMHIRDEFRAAGISAEEVDGKTPVTDRDELFKRFNAGQFKVFVNVGVLKQGVDIPPASCVILARPTLSYVFFRQAVGRVKRPFPGKQHCILIDHAGACWRHGLPDDDVEWQLDKTANINKTQTKKNQPKEAKPRTCPKCFAMWRGGGICPQCGTKLSHQPALKHNKSGMLVEVTKIAKDDAEETMKRYWGKCLGQQFHRGGKVISAKKTFYDRFKRWPPGNWANVPGIEDNAKRVAEVFPDLPARARAARAAKA